MINQKALVMAAAFRWIMILATAWAALLIIVARNTAQLGEAAQPHITSGEPNTSSNNVRLAAIRADNERLRSELSKLPELTATAEKLRTQTAATTNDASADLWAAESNAIAQATEQTRREMAALGEWFREHNTAKEREAALARMTERMIEAAGKPEQLDMALKQHLTDLALARKNLAELGKVFRQLDPASKEQFRPKLQEASAQWNAAYQKLGKDSVLFRELPITNNAPDLSKTVMMRSLLPDGAGRVMTIYLDGTIEYAPGPATPN